MQVVLLWVLCGLRCGKRGVGEGGLPELKNLGALEVQHVPEHPIDGVEQLGRCGDRATRACDVRLCGLIVDIAAMPYQSNRQHLLLSVALVNDPVVTNS
jgi:hypothetical protein